MFSTLLLDINKTLTNSILYQAPKPLQKAGVPRYCIYAKDSFRGKIIFGHYQKNSYICEE